MKRKTKAQKTEEQTAALLQRITDVYSGAGGCCWDSEEEWPTAEYLARIVPALKCMFPDAPEHLWAPCNLHFYDTPGTLTDRFYAAGVRA